MPATVIAERVGWERGLRCSRSGSRELRPVYLPPDPASRTTYLPGEIAQFDFWFPDNRVAGRVRAGPHREGVAGVDDGLRVLPVARGCWSARAAQDLYAGWWLLLQRFGRVPRVLVWDGEGALGRWRPRESELTPACHAFRGVLGAKVLICSPADPEAKGLDGVDHLVPGQRAAAASAARPGRPV